jgi:plastocyanin
VALAAAVALTAAGCASSGEPSDAPAGAAQRTSEVTAKDLRFNPARIEVPAGTTVTWRFDDRGVPHDVVADGFHSERMSGGTFTHQFTEAGTYAYKCSLHQGMTGEVIVTK